MADLLSKVEKYINSEEILKFAVGIEVPELKPVKESSLKRKEDEHRFERSDRGYIMIGVSLVSLDLHP